jgi:hypothetical protein
VNPNWKLLEQVFTAETLMTPAGELFSCEAGSHWGDIAGLFERTHFDVIPVTSDGKITGLLTQACTDVLPVTHDWLISADTSVPALIEFFVETGRPGYLLLQGREIIGLVTPADLNKVPARSFIYLLIGELEMMLAAWISHQLLTPEEILEQLGARRQELVRTEWSRLVRGNAEVNVIELLTLSDLLGIIERREELRAFFEFPSRSRAEDYLGGLRVLRNDTMHVVRPLIRDLPGDLLTLQERIRRAGELLTRLNGAGLEG